MRAPRDHKSHTHKGAGRRRPAGVIIIRAFLMIFNVPRRSADDGGFHLQPKKKKKETFESSATISTTQPLLCVCGGLYKLWHKNVNGSLLRRGGTLIARESTSQQVNTKLSKTPKGGKEEEEHEKFQS